MADLVDVTLPVHGPGAHRLVAHAQQHGVYLRDLSPMSPRYEGRSVRTAVRGGTDHERVVATCRSAPDAGARYAGRPRRREG